MTIPAAFAGRMRLPAIVAPMFLVSGPDLVVETCKAGLIGTFPSLNQRTSEDYGGWLAQISERLQAFERSGGVAAPFGVNLISHRTNERLEVDLRRTVEHRVPLVITSLGVVPEIVTEIHSYGGLVFHDVINLKHARKAAEAGVDGIIAVSAGAGGHGGMLNPLAFVHELKEMFDGTVILSGTMSNGAQIAAARLMGADLAYLGTRFVATQESIAPQAYKDMILGATIDDIIYTPRISGVPANFLKPSINAAGLDADRLPEKHGKIDLGPSEAKVWKNIWSAGQGVGGVKDIPTVAALCERLEAEYRQSMEREFAFLSAMGAPPTTAGRAVSVC